MVFFIQSSALGLFPDFGYLCIYKSRCQSCSLQDYLFLHLYSKKLENHIIIFHMQKVKSQCFHHQLFPASGAKKLPQSLMVTSLGFFKGILRMLFPCGRQFNYNVTIVATFHFIFNGDVYYYAGHALDFLNMWVSFNSGKKFSQYLL